MSILQLFESLNSSLTSVELSTPPSQLVPKEGLHVLHLFGRMDRELWETLSFEEQQQRLKRLQLLIEEIEVAPQTELRLMSVISPKADLGMMLITPNLHDLDRWVKCWEAQWGGGFLPTFSYFSMTERSEYGRSEEEYQEELKREGLTPQDPAFEEKMATFREHRDAYVTQRLYPNLPEAKEWPLLCFYPMSKRRGPEQNWYRLSFQERKKLMQGHAMVGRRYAGKIKQLITGSTGLDDQEWGVSLFAQNSSDIKDIVYEMRFDEVSFEYAEFGEFFIGLVMSLPEWVERMGWRKEAPQGRSIRDPRETLEKH